MKWNIQIVLKNIYAPFFIFGALIFFFIGMFNYDALGLLLFMYALGFYCLILAIVCIYLED